MKQKLFRLLSMLSLFVLYCSTAGAASENDLVAIDGTYTFVAENFMNEQNIAEETLLDNNRVFSPKGNSYNGKKGTSGLGKNCLRLKSLQNTLVFKVSIDATVTVYHQSHNSRIIVASSNSSFLTAEGFKKANANLVEGAVSTGETSFDVSANTTIYMTGTDITKYTDGDFYISGFTVTPKVIGNQVAAPLISPTEGATFGSPSTVSISCDTEGASIYYTTDGNTPSTSSTLYSSPFKVNSACTIKAFAVYDGMVDSQVSSADVTINDDRLISFDFSTVSVTGKTPSNLKLVDNAVYNLNPGKTYFIEGKTQTAWKDAEANEYTIGYSITANKDYVLSPVFVDNTVSIGDGPTTVNWTFARENGAPAIAYEGNVGYYAQQATINGTPIDVVMTIDTQKGAAGTGFETNTGKCNNASKETYAQVNTGTVFKIPAVKGMEITFTKTNSTFEADAVLFNGANGTSSGKNMTYTYNGEESEMTIIVKQSGLYPSGIKVDYPASPAKDATLSGIKVNEIALAGFSSTILIYNHELPALTVDIPVVTATATNSAATVSITQAESTNGTATISVTSADGSVRNEYVINFSVKPASNDATLNQVVFSNSFDAFIKNSAEVNTITAYYLEGEDVPTISEVDMAENATYTVSGDILTVTAEDKTTSVDYKLIVRPVSPYVGFDRTFDGTESWVKNGYGFDAVNNRGYRFSKTDNDNSRERDGRTRIYFFVGAYQTISLYTATGITSDRNIKVYVNGVKNSITKAPKYSSSTPGKIDITIGEKPSMVAIVSDQTSGDGGFGSIKVAGLDNPTKNVSIPSSLGYASYCSEYALDFTDVTDLSAYVASAAVDGKVSMTKVTQVPANTGLILKSASGAGVSDVVVPVIESANTVGTNLLVGTVAGATVNPSSAENGYNYLFGKKNEVVGFYKLVDNTYNLGVNKAYLHTAADITPAMSSAKGVIMDFGDGETTAISNIDADVPNDAIYYNLNGQCVVNPVKGVYILNGKKVMVK